MTHSIVSFHLAGTDFGVFLTDAGLALGGDEFAFTQSFLDHEYATSSSGYVANSWDVDKSAVTIWGADGDYKSDGTFDLTPATPTSVRTWCSKSSPHRVRACWAFWVSA